MKILINLLTLSLVMSLSCSTQKDKNSSENLVNPCPVKDENLKEICLRQNLNIEKDINLQNPLTMEDDFAVLLDIEVPITGKIMSYFYSGFIFNKHILEFIKIKKENEYTTYATIGHMPIEEADLNSEDMSDFIDYEFTLDSGDKISYYLHTKAPGSYLTFSLFKDSKQSLRVSRFVKNTVISNQQAEEYIKGLYAKVKRQEKIRIYTSKKLYKIKDLEITIPNSPSYSYSFHKREGGRETDSSLNLHHDIEHYSVWFGKNLDIVKPKMTDKKIKREISDKFVFEGYDKSSKSQPNSSYIGIIYSKVDKRPLCALQIWETQESSQDILGKLEKVLETAKINTN